MKDTLRPDRTVVRRGRWLYVFCAVSIALLAILFSASFSYFKNAELELAQNRGSIYRSILVSALDRFQHLPFVLAQDPLVIAALEGRDREGLNRRLAAFADRAKLDAIYLMDRSGLTIAASNHDAPVTFLGQNYGFRPYFREALAGRRGEFFAIGATTSRPGYFVAELVRGPDGRTNGVITIKLDLSDLAKAWAAGGEAVLVSNSDGVVVLSSDPSWLYRTLAPIPPERRTEIDAERQFGDEPLSPLDWSETEDGRVDMDGRGHLHVQLPVSRLGWTLHFLADGSRVLERVLFTVGAAAVVLALLLALAIFLRSERIREALRASQADRRQLQETNLRLEREIEERRVAERRLESAHSELARASKLAALGQLAASVTHELGQPIAAMRNYLAAEELEAEAPAQRNLLTRLGDLVRRMESITKQLRFFAKPAAEPLLETDLRDVLEGARVVLEHELGAPDVDVSIHVPDEAVPVRANRLRLEQVLINLVRNSMDAMQNSDRRSLAIRIGTAGSRAFLSVQDSGHGVGDRSIEQLQEPFHTTRASGEGMGLGLAISSAIINEHDGTLSVENGRAGGAVFCIELPLAIGQEAA